MSFKTEIFAVDHFASEAATRVVGALPGGGSLVLTGGTTFEPLLPQFAAKKPDWAGVEIAFSDERCVPPDHAASNYGMARRLFLDAIEPGKVHRMKGELEPPQGAAEYHLSVTPLVERGFDLLLLGMGADAHIGALYPLSPGLGDTAYCAAVDRPDGLQGLTLTPPAMMSAKKVFLLVSGEVKAATVRRAVTGDEAPETCPVRLLADHPDVTFLLDEAAASHLQR
ncbi:MAG: 6-phosphogluconolactonase [Actinobacteria bacterium]|nr:6-phosphogluconolactonase [Actinomycetota bacterium]